MIVYGATGDHKVHKFPEEPQPNQLGSGVTQVEIHTLKNV